MTDKPVRAAGLPPRERAEPTTKTPEEIIKDAPLHTSQAEQTNPAEEKAPWRIGTSMSKEELMMITEKGSFNLPLELILRLNYLVNYENSRSIGKKTNKTEMLNESLDEYTTRKLKKLGHKVD